MAVEESNKKILLLQIRDKPAVRAEELSSFTSFAGISSDQIDVLNVFDRPFFPPEIVDDYAALIVGGASEASVLEPDVYTFLPDCVRMLQYVLENSIPCFASCFGFQLAVVALEGKIVRDKSGFEIGTVPISLTELAETDLIMAELPDPFYAVSVHRERAPHLPQQCELLAYTDKCPHAFKVKGKPFWAFQFHPEVDKKILVERLTIYSEQYTDDAEHLQDVLRGAVETPESNLLVRKFVDYLRSQNLW